MDWINENYHPVCLFGREPLIGMGFGIKILRRGKREPVIVPYDLDSVSDIYTFFSINSDLQSLIPALPVLLLIIEHVTQIWPCALVINLSQCFFT